MASGTANGRIDAHDAGIEGRLFSPIVVGRERELEALLEGVGSTPALAVIEGESGVGKTRLLQELLEDRRLRGRLRLLGHCPPLREPLALAPLVEAIREAAPNIDGDFGGLTGSLATLLPELADRLPPPPPPLQDPRIERHRTFEAMRELLCHVGPCILAIEDLHWADPGSIDFLRFLLSAPPPNVALVCTFRREDLGSPEVSNLFAKPRSQVSFVRVSLRPLPPAAVRSLVSAVFRTDDVSEEFGRYLHERTGGVPFIVEEVLWLLRDCRDIVARDRGWVRQTLASLEVPASLRDWLLERMAAVRPECRRILRAAAVLRVLSDLRTLAAVAGMPIGDARRATVQCVDAALLEGDGERYALRHMLARDAVYRSVPETERRRLHLRAARILETLVPKPHVQLAYHFRAALKPAEWARHAEAAARRAMRIGDDAAAARFLQDALEAPGLARGPRIRLVTALGEAALHGLTHAQAAPVLQALLEEEGLPAGTRGEIALSLGLLLIQAGDAGRGFAAVQDAFPLLRRRPRLAARAAATLASPWGPDVRTDDLRGWLDRAITASERQSDPVVRTAVLVDRADVLLCIADPDAEDAIEQVPWTASSIGERRQLVRGRLNLAQAAFHLGRYREARSHLTEGDHLSRQLGYARQQGALDTTAILIDWATGQWEGLRSRCEDLREAAHDVPHASVDAQFVLGSLLAARGADEATAVLERACATARACGSLPIFAAAAAQASANHLAGGDTEAALRIAAEAFDALASTAIWVWAAPLVPSLVAAGIAAGEVAEAERALPRFAAGVRGRNAPAAQAARLMARGLLMEGVGRREPAARCFHEAGRAYALLPNPYRTALAGEARARCLLRVAGPRTSLPAMRKALLTFLGLGARRDAARMRRLLREAGVRPAPEPHAGRRGYGGDLSPREVEIASLVAQGKRNQEIADMLYLSKRTVEVHIASAMRKLDATSRTGLAVELITASKNT